MLAIVLLGLVAGAYAAPQFYHRHHHGPFPRDDDLAGYPYFQDEIFDARRFWAELSREMAMFDQMMNDFTKHFPSSVSSEGVDPETNQYKVTIPLSGFEEKDVVVKAREGVLMVQAVSKPEGGMARNYLDVRTLPDYVNVNGSWTFSGGVLKVVFPLLQRGEETTTEISTQLPEELKPESREEVDNRGGDVDVDVGVISGDTAKETELMTNEIPNREPVEATTYAVDLKDEVEFVPVRY